ncbi:MAG: InlB B-repeat-containing protein [Coprococcus sp.]
MAGTSTKLSFTAKYTDTVKRVRIVFAPNGGRVSSGSKTVICGKTYGTLPTPTRRGYTFAGWYTAKSGGSRIGSSSVVRTTRNQTLYARWKLVKYKIQYRLGKGKTAGPIQPVIPSRLGLSS